MLRTLLCALGAICLLILAACGGGTAKAPASGNQSAGPSAPADTQGELDLALQAQAEGTNWRITLSAPNATDLYQIAGSISYDTTRFSVVTAEAGGGLGGPVEALYVSGEPEPGRLDFAYTKRAAGPGFSGQLNLYSVVVQPLDGAAQLSPAQVASEFRLELAEGRIRARDSRKQDLRCRIQEVR